MPRDWTPETQDKSYEIKPSPNIEPMCAVCGWHGSWDDLLGGGEYCPGCRGEFTNYNEQDPDDEK